MHQIQDDPETARQVLTFFAWAYRNGGKMALDLDYVPMPPEVVKLVERTWQTRLKDSSGTPIWK